MENQQLKLTTTTTTEKASDTNMINVKKRQRKAQGLRREFSRKFKAECALQVLRGEKKLKDFVGADGEPIHYGNVQHWVDELLVGKYGKQYAKMIAEPVKVKVPAEAAPAISGEGIKELVSMFAETLKKSTILEIENERLRAATQYNSNARALFAGSPAVESLLNQYVSR